ncbi:hypothetical protein [Chthonobacter rhizosphaerae]|uniref:hypothetical protein n=1 Tax=Chthonobacter rhizosphaerae TaxID=2735553 RepID=UPI0015EEF655|nr:hypothetical protein [Chthonobacter rhizosphaerae]
MEFFQNEWVLAGTLIAIMALTAAIRKAGDGVLWFNCDSDGDGNGDGDGGGDGGGD